MAGASDVTPTDRMWPIIHWEIILSWNQALKSRYALCTQSQHYELSVINFLLFVVVGIIVTCHSKEASSNLRLGERAIRLTCRSCQSSDTRMWSLIWVLFFISQVIYGFYNAAVFLCLFRVLFLCILFCIFHIFLFNLCRTINYEYLSLQWSLVINLSTIRLEIQVLEVLLTG